MGSYDALLKRIIDPNRERLNIKEIHSVGNELVLMSKDYQNGPLLHIVSADFNFGEKGTSAQAETATPLALPKRYSSGIVL
ncbi:hypothetical protein [Desulfatibacillum aliphaticivorans]|uniref:hypothetical protein n=1 Tax=Desulfatibacillum aliphaticivorans TaxID=218208 RepID=UPI00047FDA05|nr:hypothetical protein [Desulfatibacillum aliphaticivorans]